MNSSSESTASSSIFGVDQERDVIDILLQSRRDQRAAERLLRRWLRSQGDQPFRIITDELKNCVAARRTILSDVTHDTQPYTNHGARFRISPLG